MFVGKAGAYPSEATELKMVESNKKPGTLSVKLIKLSQFCTNKLECLLIRNKSLQGQ